MAEILKKTLKTSENMHSEFFRRIPRLNSYSTIKYDSNGTKITQIERLFAENNFHYCFWRVPSFRQARHVGKHCLACLLVAERCHITSFLSFPSSSPPPMTTSRSWPQN